MKISREQKAINRQKLLLAGVEVMSKEGIKSATMKKIAAKAGLSEAVIYKYFPTKDDLLVAFFDNSLTEAIKTATDNKNFAELTFREQLQFLLDCHLDQFRSHREFVKLAFKGLFLTSFAGAVTYLSEQKKQFAGLVSELMTAAVAAGEFTTPPVANVLSELLWDFHMGMIYYWINDSSENEQRTTQLADRSLGFVEEILRSQVLGKFLDIVYYLAREHFLKGFDKVLELTDTQKRTKTEILGKTNGNSHVETRKKKNTSKNSH